jgi:hypothetical protein
MSQFAGEFVYGDTAKPLYYYVRQNGEPLDVSALDSATLVMARSNVTVSIAGVAASTISDTSAIEFSASATGAVGSLVPQPESRLTPDIYECRIKFFLDGLLYYTDPFRLAIVRFP